MSELFEEHQWTGEFFIPGNYGERFPGKVEYSPNKGIILSYSIAGQALHKETNVLFGVLLSGEKCTLFGEFNPLGLPTLHNGLHSFTGKSAFQCLLLGDFLKNDELIFDINFSLTNLQEFFFSKGHKELVKFSEKPLLSIKTNFGKVEVGNNATFGFLPSDISAQIYSRNKDALKELTDAFIAIKEKHPDAGFMLKHDIAYRISLNFDNGETVIGSYEHLYDLSCLFALLTYSPVYPDSIQIKKKGENGSVVSIKVFPAISVSDETIKLCIEDQSHYRLPLTYSKINLANTFERWLESASKYSSIVSGIQNETGFREEHTLHGEFVLHTTQLEAISYDASMKEKKYVYPLETYGTPKIVSAISDIFSAIGEKDIGKAIGDLRNEIAHVGRPKSLLTKLQIGELVLISQCLQIAIIGYILERLGISKDVITEYQDKIF